MKKSNWIAIIVSLVLVLCVSFGVTYFFLNKDKTYTPSSSLNAGITEGMKMHEIAEMYVDSCVSVHVEATSSVGTVAALGSGVCIAANEYETASGYKASFGSYFVTNYHVISYAADPMYSNYTTSIYICPNMSEDRYKTELLWSSKDLDLAILYCDEDLKMGWIEMKDRSVACPEEDKLGFDSIFTIGTPLKPSFQNTYSEGRVKNLNLELTSNTATELYTYNAGGKLGYTTDKRYAESLPKGINVNSKAVFDNAYQDIVMMSCEITNGNSGGGVFDEKGYLIGLSTLGLGYESANTAAINFFVPIYPITLVLDKIILNKETGVGNVIFSPESMGLKVIDAQEAATVTAEDSETGEVFNEVTFNAQTYYYFDGEMYLERSYRNAFSFVDDGVYVMINDGTYSQLIENFVITGANKSGVEAVITNRNDLLYFLLNCNKGDVVNFYGKVGFLSRSFTVTL